MKDKITELAQKYQIPPELLTDALKYEKERVVAQKRRKEPILRLIERYSDGIKK